MKFFLSVFFLTHCMSDIFPYCKRFYEKFNGKLLKSLKLTLAVVKVTENFGGQSNFGQKWGQICNGRKVYNYFSNKHNQINFYCMKIKYCIKDLPKDVQQLSVNVYSNYVRVVCNVWDDTTSKRIIGGLHAVLQFDILIAYCIVFTFIFVTLIMFSNIFQGIYVFSPNLTW